MSTPGYNRLTDAQVAALAFWGQDNWHQLRDNQDAFDAAISQLLAQSNNAIVDDFLCGGFGRTGADNDWDASVYNNLGSSATVISLVASTGDHVLQLQSINNSALRGLSVLSGRASFRLNQDMAMFVEVRAKDIGGAAPDNLIVGLTHNLSASNENDVIAFLKGTTAGKWRFRVASGGVGTQTDNIGNRATWQKLRMELLRSGSGATLQVAAYIDGAAISGSPFTTNIPTSTPLYLIPIAHNGVASGTTDVRIDRLEARWTAVPVNS